VQSQHNIRFDHLTVKDGLSQSGVTCIFQDHQGFMWFGTQDGLNRYDGYTFTVFKHDPTDPKSLNENFISLIAEDKDKTLWIGTLNNPKTLNKFDRVTETFAQRDRDSVDLKGVPKSAVFSSYEDPSGVQWSGTIGGGVTRFNPRTGDKRAYKHDAANPNSLLDDRVYSVYGDRSGIIWIGTKSGLNKFNPATETFVHYKRQDNDPESLSDDWVWPILEDQSGTLWVGTVRGGLNRFNRQTGKFTHYKHKASNPNSLSDDYVLSLYQDRSGVLWIGTSNEGLNRFHPALRPFAHFTTDPSNPQSLVHSAVRTICVDAKGVSWIGTEGGLDRFDRTRGTFQHYTHSPSNPKSLSDNFIVCLYTDRTNALWVGTFSNGLDRFDEPQQTFKHYRHDPANPKSLSDNRVYALCEDRSGTLWVGTYGRGLNRFDKATQTFARFEHSDSIAHSLSANRVLAIHEDRTGTLWVGTFGGGLNRFERETQTFTHFTHDAANANSLSDNNVLAIHEDRAGVLWIGTVGGLNRFDPRTEHFERFREKDGLPNDVIFGILEDNSGNLWLSTNNGLSKFNPQNNTFRNYDYDDGLQANEFNQNAYGKNALTGEMYFGGSNGFNVFHPDSVNDNPFVPPIVFSAFRRYNSDDVEGKPIDESGIPSRREIALTYKDNIAIFEFAALNYHNTFKNRYAYKLEGFSENWIQLGSERRATFTNLDPGEYTLRVNGSNNDGVWNNEGIALKLMVTPPWWKTRWAYSVYGILFFGLLYGLRTFEINRREQKARVRESELRAKAAEAQRRVLEMENERKTKELEEARTLQLSMLPNDLPRLPHLEIAVFMKTATEVGGDYYDFQLGEDGALNIALGDATGHGMKAGTIVTLMKGLFTANASRLDLQAFFNHCTKAFKEIRLGRMLMGFSLIRIAGNKISFSSGGMPPLFMYRKHSGTVQEILLKGMPLGAMKTFPYVIHEEVLQQGDAVLLLTDGLPEQKNAAHEMFDYARVRTTFTEVAECLPDEIVRHLVATGEEWMKGTVQEDDITIIAIKIKAMAQ
jgi:ligand-binding sensor domain-containing protein/serine phosphatase RsbU (regulator of sigma subunit)